MYAVLFVGLPLFPRKHCFRFNEDNSWECVRGLIRYDRPVIYNDIVDSHLWCAKNQFPRWLGSIFPSWRIRYASKPIVMITQANIIVIKISVFFNTIETHQQLLNSTIWSLVILRIMLNFPMLIFKKFLRAWMVVSLGSTNHISLKENIVYQAIPFYNWQIEIINISWPDGFQQYYLPLSLIESSFCLAVLLIVDSLRSGL